MSEEDLFIITLGNQYDMGCTLAKVRLQDISQAYSFCRKANDQGGVAIKKFWMKFRETKENDDREGRCNEYSFTPVDLPKEVMDLRDVLRPISTLLDHAPAGYPAMYTDHHYQPSKYGHYARHLRHEIIDIPIDRIIIEYRDHPVATIMLSDDDRPEVYRITINYRNVEETEWAKWKSPTVDIMHELGYRRLNLGGFEVIMGHTP